MTDTRKCTLSPRVRSSKYRGVTLDNKKVKMTLKGGKIKEYTYKGSWRAFIRLNGKSKHLGYHTSEEKAARSYDEAAKKYYGLDANLNFK